MVPGMSTTKPLLGPRSAGAHALLLAFVGAGAALVALVLVWLAVSRDAADVTVFLTNQARLDLDAGLDLPGGAVLLGDLVGVDLHVPDVPLGLRLLAAAGSVLLFLSIAAGALALAQVLRSVRVGRPFARGNATRLQVVAAAVLVGGVLAPMARDAAGFAALDHLGLTDEDSPFLSQLTVPLTPVLLAVAVVGIAEAFRRGALLADDVVGLV